MFFNNNDKSLEEKVLIEIGSLLDDGVYPSIGKIAKRLDMENSLNSIQIATDKLLAKGFITKDEKRKISSITENGKIFLRGNDTRLANNFRTVDVPILGSIACGNPTYAFEDIKGYVSLSEEIAKNSAHVKYFILEATGDSMNQKGINEGDLLLLQQQNHAQNGQIILALISNESATLKEFRQNIHGFIQLIPHSDNAAHKPIIVGAENLQIQGILVKNLGSF